MLGGSYRTLSYVVPTSVSHNSSLHRQLTCSNMKLVQIILSQTLPELFCVLGGAVRVVDGRGLRKACSAWDDRFTRCDKSVFRAWPIQACRLPTRSPFFKLSAVRPVCESVGVLLKYPTWTCIFDALDEGPHANMNTVHMFLIFRHGHRARAVQIW